MVLLVNIVLFLTSVLAARKWLLSRFPKFQSNVESLEKFTSLLGFLALILGISDLVDLLFHRGHFIIRLITGLVLIGMGYVQGREMILTIMEKLGLKWNYEKWYHKLLPRQESLGLVGLVLVVIHLILYFKAAL